MEKLPVEHTIKENQGRYGDFTDLADVAQRLKQVVWDTKGFERLSLSQREAIEMIMVKVARILNGNPNYEDSWHDIAGYATLAEQRCKKGETS